MRHDPRAYSVQYRRGNPLQLHPVRNRSSGVAGERRNRLTQFSPHKIQRGGFARPPRTNDERPEGNCTILSLTRRERSAWGDVPMGGMYGRGIQAGVWIHSVMRTRVPKARPHPSGYNAQSPPGMAHIPWPSCRGRGAESPRQIV